MNIRILSAADSPDEEVRVLCWVMTNPKNHETKAAAVNVTWGQHCTVLLFISSKLGKLNEEALYQITHKSYLQQMDGPGVA